MKALILYYSYSGNTKKIAEMIQSKIGGDMLEITTKTPYTGSYNDVVEQGHTEVKKGFKPEITPENISIADYDTIVLGTPVWWYTYAPAVNTLISSLDFSGKTIYPFATNGGWLGHTFEDIKKNCKNADVKDGLNIYFSSKNLRTPEKEISAWIDKIK